MRQLDAHPEAGKQAVVADKLLVTKSDLAGADELAALRRRLRELNPGADIVTAGGHADDWRWLADAENYDPLSKQLDVQAWLRVPAYRQVRMQPGLRRLARAAYVPTPDPNRHGPDIRAFCLSFDEPLPWDGLLTALEMIAGLHGKQLLRVKGIVNARGQELPRVVHVVQHVFFPAVTLARWPNAQRSSHLVFIVRDLEEAFIIHTLNHFLRAGVEKEGADPHAGVEEVEG
jgi:G3E family GTPase